MTFSAARPSCPIVARWPRFTAAYKWGMSGVWGISNRIEYEAPRDEIDRMFVVTARKK